MTGAAHFSDMDWTMRPHGYVSPPPAPPAPDRVSASTESSDSVDTFVDTFVDTSVDAAMGMSGTARPAVETGELVKLEPTEPTMETSSPNFDFDAFSAKGVAPGFYGSEEKKDDCSRDLVGGGCVWA